MPNAFANIVAITRQMSSPGAEGGPAASGRRPARQRGAVGGSGFGVPEPRPPEPQLRQQSGVEGRRLARAAEGGVLRTRQILFGHKSCNRFHNNNFVVIVTDWALMHLLLFINYYMNSSVLS